MGSSSIYTRVKMKIFLALLLASVALAQEQDLIDTLSRLGCSQTVALIERGGLTDVIRNGEFTVFAPTDAAWDALPDYIKRVIIGAPEYLAQVLTFHVTVGRVMAGDITDEGLVPSVEGSNIRTTIRGGGSLVLATGSPVSAVDAVASNGIIHLIDRVMFPLPRSTIFQEAAFDPDLSILASLVGVADLGDVLNNPLATFTLFAPGNDAFRALGQDVLDDLIANPERLRGILLYHVLPSTEFGAGLQNGEVGTAFGPTVRINIDNGVMVNDANVEFADAAASNGVIHFVDKVLLPPSRD